jgi:SAM-dependent methyltransferase
MDDIPERRQDNRPKLLVNIGSGPKGSGRLPAMFAEWREVRVDVDADARPDILADICDLSVIESGAADAVWASHCLEHIFLHQVSGTIAEIYRILRDDGFLCAMVPDLQKVAEYVVQDRLHEVVYQSAAGPVTAHDMIYGFGAYLAQGRERMAHRCGFTPGVMLQAVRGAPFAEIVLRRRTNHELAVVACKRAPAGEAERQALLAALEL